MPDADSAPADHEIELSLFGKGYGECALAHLGSGKWMLVDSLRTAKGNPAALVYLSRIGVNAASALTNIIVTHWHDDHVSGIAEIYSQCPLARVAIPGAMAGDEWRAFRQAVSGAGSERFTSGVAELGELAEFKKKYSRPAFVRASADKLLLDQPGDQWAHGLPVSVRLLSPSDHDVEAFHERLARAKVPEPVSRVSPFPRNDLSVAAWLSVGEHNILLGGDLEVTGNPESGWDAILNSPARIQGVAALYKIAHHGSENGHHADIWGRHLSASPNVALAPFSRPPHLPRQTDIDRILHLTPNCFATSRPRRRTKSRDAAVERTIRENGHKVYSTGNVGQVRFRLDPRKPENGWTVELLDGAVRLSELREIAA